VSKVVFIYALVSERDGCTLPWYIGQTVDCEHRLQDHLRECEIFKTRQAEWTRKEKADGFQVALRIIEETVKDNAHEREEYWIAKLRQVNPELKNSTAGNAHNGRQKYLLKVQAQQRERLQQDAAWLAQILKTFLPKPARMDGRTK